MNATGTDSGYGIYSYGNTIISGGSVSASGSTAAVWANSVTYDGTNTILSGTNPGIAAASISTGALEGLGAVTFDTGKCTYINSSGNNITSISIVKTYTVSFSTGSGSTVGAQSVAYGGYAAKSADPSCSGCTFGGWYTDGTYSTAFDFSTMPITGDTTIYAKWTKTSSSGSGGSTTTTPSVTTATSGSVTTGTASVTGTTSNGTQTVSVPGSTMTSLTGAAKAAEKSGGSAVSVIDAGAGTGLSHVSVTIPGTQFASFASGTSAALEINSGFGSVTFCSGAVDTISAAGSGDAAIHIGTVDISALSAGQQQAVGDRPVYSFSVAVGDTGVSAFGSDVTVSIPYMLGANENPNAIVVYYLDASGNLQPMQGKYDAATGSVIFEMTHFSDYVIGYNKVDFSDVAGTAWYADAVTYLAARGVTSGTTATAFSPDATLTRGQFITLLLKAYGIEAANNAADNFSDTGDTYYTGYLAAAKHLGITSGVGDNKFAPEQAISRQQTFTLLYNALKVLDKLPEGSSGKTLSDFTDCQGISSYAQEAMAYLVKTGVVGGNNGLLLPQSTATRAQMAQVLYNLMGK